MKKQATLFQALLPIIFLILALSFNVLGVYGDDALSGSNQLILLASGFVALLVGRINKVEWKDLFDSIGTNIGNAGGAIVILLLIGALASSWLLGGVVPAMVYYGLDLLHPSFFLPAALVISAAVSLATGSSWSTTATIGIALIGIGKALGISDAMTAGAVISGAYFGDKMSPLSDTTNLAPAMAGTDLFTHIRYMAITTVPSILITLVVFFFLGLSASGTQEMGRSAEIQSVIAQHFNITPWLFFPAVGVVLLIVRKVPAIPSVFAGVLMGILCAAIFQTPLIHAMQSMDGSIGVYRLMMDTMANGISIETGNLLVDELLSASGMEGMMGTIWLILSAMVFGGAMEGAGLLDLLSERLMRLAKTEFALVGTTTATCVGLNVTASDQYLAIVVPGRMYSKAFKEKGLAPENLSRTLEDSGTVTSVLVPWNTCGAYQSSVLGVATGAYLPFAIFNWLSPIMTLVFSRFNIRIKRLGKS